MESSEASSPPAYQTAPHPPELELAVLRGEEEIHSLARPGQSHVEFPNDLPDGFITPSTKFDSQPPSVEPSLYHPAEPLPWYREGLLIAVCVSSQIVAQSQFGAILVPIEDVGNWLGVKNDNSQLAWMLASYGMTLGLFVLLTGRLGDIYGSKNIFIAGYVVTAIFQLASGFCKTTISFDVCRAFVGIGGAMLLPNGAGIMGRTFPPGRKRTVGFAVMGACGPAGFVSGSIVGSLIVLHLGPKWLFFLGAINGAVFAIISWFTLPEEHADREGFLDLRGAILGLAGMMMFNFAWNQGSVVGWDRPYVYSILIASILVLVIFFFYEKRQQDRALLPVRIFKKEVILVCLVMWWGWMSLGSFIFYTTSYLRDIRGIHNPLEIASQLLPILPCGTAAALAIIKLFTAVPAHWILAVAMICFGVGALLVSLAPVHQTYWAMIFPAVSIMVWGPDLSFASAALVVSNSVDRTVQGVANGLIVLIVNYSMSIGLGMGGTIQLYVNRETGDLLLSYRAALWFATGMAFLGFVLVAALLRTKAGHGEMHVA